MSAATTALPGKLAAKATPLDNLRTLLPYVGRYRARTLLGIGMLLAGGLVGAMLPLVMGTIVDSISGAHSLIERMGALPGPLERFLLSFYRPLSGETLVFFSLTLLAIVLLKGTFSFFTRSILIGVSRDIEYDLRSELLDHLLQLEPAFYVRNRTGELMSRCTNDLNAVRMVLGPGIMYSLNTIVIMVMAVSIMTRISSRLTLYVFLPVPAVALAVYYFGKLIHDRYEKIQALLAGLSARVQENLTGIRVVRAFCQEEYEGRAFERQNKEYVDRNMELIAAWSLFFPSLEFLIGIVFLIVLWQGSRQTLSGDFSLGALMAFYGYITQLVWPMVALGWVTNIFQRGAASMGRLRHIFSAQPEIDDRGVAVTPGQEIRGEVEFRHLTFRHPTAEVQAGARPVLDDVSLKIPAGSTVAIVGPTGCGKSTLAALVARLWDAPAGSLLIDGRPITEWPLETLRRSIGFVAQDSFLFSDTLRENIAFGAESASDLDIDRAANIASIRAEILDFPKQFETLVGERGLTLSGGQKQRTTLARA
ncbi:MAG TPA: ABC transporter ATP-binding protein, partial [Candidatus Acidoferrales bacterium]|nr:ABC transporter ATP-binding protein [Candidatus Acidoferrales bacterium]